MQFAVMGDHAPRHESSLTTRWIDPSSRSMSICKIARGEPPASPDRMISVKVAADA